MTRAPLQTFARPQARSDAGLVARPTQPLSKPGRPAGVQMWVALGKAPWMDANGQWQTTNAAVAGGTRASLVEGKDLKLANKAAGGGLQAIGADRNRPSVNPLAWGTLQAYQLALRSGVLGAGGKRGPSPPNYARMHMLNGRLGGSGATTDNLAPGSNSMNGRHSANFEQVVFAALRKGDTVDSFKVQASYQAPSGALVGAVPKAAWQYTLSKVVCQATHIPAGKAGAQNLINLTINETAGLDTQPNWKGL